MEAMYASATNPVATTAAWAIHLAYPVAREKTVATEIDSIDRRREDIRARSGFAISARRWLRQAPCQHARPSALARQHGASLRLAPPQHASASPSLSASRPDATPEASSRALRAVAPLAQQAQTRTGKS